MSEEAENTTNQSSTITFDKILDERGVPLGNVLKEVTRKLNKFGSMEAKIDMLLQKNATAVTSSDEEANAAPTVDLKTKKYVDHVLEEMKLTEIDKAQNVVLDQVFKTFPELLKDSDDFDQAFFNLAVEYEKGMDRKDPERPMKAAKLAALELGKMERITKAKLLQDEARRTRMLTEGVLPARENSKQTAPKTTMNKKTIEKWFKVDPSKVEKMIKEEEG